MSLFPKRFIKISLLIVLEIVPKLTDFPRGRHYKFLNIFRKVRSQSNPVNQLYKYMVNVFSCPIAVAVGLCISMIAYLRLPSLKVSILLLLGLVVYDVFWVRPLSALIS